MSAGEKPGQIITGTQQNSTAIARGNLVVRNTVTDEQQMVLSGANTAKPAGVALDASPGITRQFPVASSGHVKVKAGGTCTQGLYCESDASGLGVDATVGAGRNVYGRFLESGVAGDLVMVDVKPERITISA